MNIKILVAYHKKAPLYSNEVLVPIHVGRAVAKDKSKDGIISDLELEWLKSNMIGDDTGDNISHLNRYFCELTALYWAWKNYDKLENPDYIGLCHYRTLFYLNKFTKHKKINGILDYVGLNRETIQKLLQKYSIIVPHPILIEELGEKRSTFFKKDAEELMLNEVPELYKEFQCFCETGLSYHKNIFLMKREDFFEYCEKVFGLLLDEYNRKGTFSDRIFGYQAEYLTSFFVNYIAKKNQYKILEVDTGDISQLETKKFSWLRLLFYGCMTFVTLKKISKYAEKYEKQRLLHAIRKSK